MPNRIYPKGTSSPTNDHESSISLQTTKSCNDRQVFTVWMKSLIMNCKGCTVFNSDGRIVCRVDNYDGKYRKEVCLMDYDGEVLMTILKKKCRLFRRWKGYRSSSSIEFDKEKPFFIVRKPLLHFPRSTSYKVTVRVDENNWDDFTIQTQSTSKSACKIIKKSSGDCLMAEVKRKQSSSGVVLGEDVLALIVEPEVDNLLVVGLVVVYGLFNNWL